MRKHRFTNIIDLGKDDTFNRDEELYAWFRKEYNGTVTRKTEGERAAELRDANPFTRPWPTLGIPAARPPRTAIWPEVVDRGITQYNTGRFQTSVTFADGVKVLVDNLFAGGPYGPTSEEIERAAYAVRYGKGRVG